MFSGDLKIAFNSICIYILIITSIRLFGKKQLAQLSIVDLVFIILLGNSVQNAMVGPDNTLKGGIISAVSLFIVNYVIKFIVYHFPGLRKVVQGRALLLIYKGQLDEKNMKKAKIPMNELIEVIREHGVESIKDVKLAILEIDGSISVLSSEFKENDIKKVESKKIVAEAE